MASDQIPPHPTPSAPPLYPSLDLSELTENLFPSPDTSSSSSGDDDDDNRKKSSSIASGGPLDDSILCVPGSILHLIDQHRSVELASGDFSLHRIRQREGAAVVALLARVGPVQWPLSREEAAVKLDSSHYFFSLRVPGDGDESAKEDLLNYGLTFASKGQEGLLAELDAVLDCYCCFSVRKVGDTKGAEVLDGSVARELAPTEVMEGGEMKEMMEKTSAAYWTVLAPNVEDYSGGAAKAIAAGSGHLVRGILWCGDVTVDRIKRGESILRRRMDPKEKPAEISPETLRRIERVRKVTKMSEKVANGILSGVIKVSGYFTSSVVNSKAGKKLLGLIPGEVVLASLEGFGKICDAVEMSGKNVLSTSSDVTTGLVSHRYGDQAAEATSQGLSATGHAIGTAWTVFKIRKAIDPKSAIKPQTLAKSAVKAAAAEIKAKAK